MATGDRGQGGVLGTDDSRRVAADDWPSDRDHEEETQTVRRGRHSDEGTPEFIDEDQIQPTIGQLIECVERELKYRRRVYPIRVAKDRMTQRQADWQIKMMEVVKTKLEELQRKH